MVMGYLITEECDTMPNESLSKPGHDVALVGDPVPLVKQLGSTGELGALATSAAVHRCPPVKTRRALRQFLRNYRAQTLIAREFPAICRACQFASRGALRELIALDQSLANSGELPELAAASQQAGRRHLQSLRPLRDLRLVQRYLQAIEEGKAHGWHTMVYGLMLALYSIPHRQGLLHYARLTLRGFIDAAAGPLRLTQADCHQLLEDLCEDLPQALENTLAGNGETHAFMTAGALAEAEAKK
jgi:urease accessory protein UreF